MKKADSILFKSRDGMRLRALRPGWNSTTRSVSPEFKGKRGHYKGKRGHYVMFKVELRNCLYQFWIYEDNELQWEHQLEGMLSVLYQDD